MNPNEQEVYNTNNELQKLKFIKEKLQKRTTELFPFYQEYLKIQETLKKLRDD